ncbi:MAG: hypothetical protein AAGI71_05975 [Bacteroidota bacterium]
MPASTEHLATPEGLFTAQGTWFRTTEEALRDYAGEVLAAVSLPTLLHYAESWLRAPLTLAVCAAPVLLFLVSPWWAAAGTLGVWVLWSLMGPAWVTLPVAALLRWLDRPLLQAGYFLFALSLLGLGGQTAAVVTGLVLFLAFRWGLVRLTLTPLLRPLLRRLYTLPVPDQVLRAFVHRLALHLRCPHPRLDAMQQHVLDHLTGPAR